jgi:hypothetical protein
MPTMAEKPEHLDKLLTEQANPASAGIDGRPTTDLLRIMNEQDAMVAGAVAAEIPQIARAVDAIAGAIRSGGRVFYIGAGTPRNARRRSEFRPSCSRGLLPGARRRWLARPR